MIYFEDFSEFFLPSLPQPNPGRDAPHKKPRRTGRKFRNTSVLYIFRATTQRSPPLILFALCNANPMLFPDEPGDIERESTP